MTIKNNERVQKRKEKSMNVYNDDDMLADRVDGEGDAGDGEHGGDEIVGSHGGSPGVGGGEVH